MSLDDQLKIMSRRPHPLDGLGMLSWRSKKTNEEKKPDTRSQITDAQLINLAEPTYITRNKTFACFCGKHIEWADSIALEIEINVESSSIFTESTAYQMGWSRYIKFDYNKDDRWHMFTIWYRVSNDILQKYSYDGIFTTFFCDLTPPNTGLTIRNYSILVCSSRCPAFVARADKISRNIEEYKNEEQDWIYRQIEPKKYPDIVKYNRITTETIYCQYQSCNKIALQFLCRNITQIAYRRSLSDSWKHIHSKYSSALGKIVRNVDPEPKKKHGMPLCDNCALELL